MIASDLTLAHLHALTGMMARQQAQALAPLMALIPLYAQRHKCGIESVWAMPAVDGVRALVDLLPGVVTPEVHEVMPEVEAGIQSALDPLAVMRKMAA